MVNTATHSIILDRVSMSDFSNGQGISKIIKITGTGISLFNYEETEKD